MKLCLITPGFSASEDDWCIPALHHLVRRLARDHQVWVVALRYPHTEGSYRFHSSKVLSLGGSDSGGLQRILLILRALRIVGRLHRTKKLDAVHGFWADEAGFVAATAGRRLGIRSVVSVMGGELVGYPDLDYGLQLVRSGRWLIRRSLTTAGRATVGSTGLLQAARPFRGKRPLTVTPLGVDTTLFRPDGERAPLTGDPCLLQVGSLSPIKDHRLSLMAFAQIVGRHPGARLHLVGEGVLGAKLVARARSLGLGDRVLFHGEVPHHQLPSFFRAADLHIVSSRFESQCMTVLEAAACSTGTVGTDVGILPDLGSSGVIAPVGDPGALAAALLERLEHKTTARELGETARTLVHREFDLDTCTARLVSVYSS
jgi:glycosyltransferase involved in cell wall biosynthesis